MEIKIIFLKMYNFVANILEIISSDLYVNVWGNFLSLLSWKIKSPPPPLENKFIPGGGHGVKPNIVTVQNSELCVCHSLFLFRVNFLQLSQTICIEEM